MDGIVQMLLPILQDNWYEVLASVLAIGAFAKLAMLRKTILAFADYVKEVLAARKDGKISDAEYIKIGKKAVAINLVLKGVMKGLFPNRSK